MKKNLPKIEKLFIRLKKAHEFYALYENDSNKLKEVESKAQPLIKELEGFGVNRELSTALLILGGKAEQLSRKEESALMKAKLLNKQIFTISK